MAQMPVPVPMSITLSRIISRGLDVDFRERYKPVDCLRSAQGTVFRQGAK
jgi:hypothetical protein